MSFFNGSVKKTFGQMYKFFLKVFFVFAWETLKDAFSDFKEKWLIPENCPDKKGRRHPDAAARPAPL